MSLILTLVAIPLTLRNFGHRNRTLLEPRPKVSRARRHGTLSFKSYSFVTMGMIMGLLLVCLYR